MIFIGCLGNQKVIIIIIETESSKFANLTMTSKNESFTISLKISGQNVSLSINTHESLDEVFQKLKGPHPQFIDKKALVLQKLISNLKCLLLSQSLTSNLNEAISVFLARNGASKKISIPQQNLTISSNVKTEKKSQRKFNQSFTQQNGTSDEKAGTIIKKLSYQPLKQNFAAVPNKKSSTPNYSKPQENRNSNRMKSFVRSSEKSNKCKNPDLIKAYQIIMKKSQNNEMKQMAKECLKEKGFLMQDKEKLHHKKHLPIHDLSNIRGEEEDQVQNKQSSREVQEPKQFGTQPQKFVPRSVENSAKPNEANTRRQYNRFSKFKYLQSSLLNESLSKQYDYSAILNISDIRPKRYSYLQY